MNDHGRGAAREIHLLWRWDCQDGCIASIVPRVPVAVSRSLFYFARPFPLVGPAAAHGAPSVHGEPETDSQRERERERERERGNCESADRMSRSNVVTLTRGLTSSPAITKKKCRRKCRRRRPWTRCNVSESRHRNATSHLFYRAEPR